MVGLDNSDYGARAPEATPGDRGPMYHSAYNASKGGLIQLTRSLATALGRFGITVNCVSPGTVPWASHQAESSASANKPRSGLGARVDPKILEMLAARNPLKRLGTAEEVAGPVRFLLSADAGYITGANLVVDGGFTAW